MEKETGILDFATYRELFTHLGLPTMLQLVAITTSIIILLSVLAPLFGFTGLQKGPRRIPLLILLFSWTIPNLYFCISQRQIPGSERFLLEHGTGRLFVDFVPTWVLHRLEVKKGPNQPWQQYRMTDFFTTELPLNGNRLENYLLVLNNTEARDRPILEDLTEQLAERIEQSPGRTSEICAFRIVRTEYSPLTDPPLLKPVDLASIETEDGWRRTGVIASLVWDEQCSED